MPEQPQWSERTLDMPPQDPWSDSPRRPEDQAPVAGTDPWTPPTVPQPSAFSTGRAPVRPVPARRQFAAEHEPTGTGWPDAAPPQPRSTARDLRRGGEWTTAAALFAIVCWGIWAIASSGSLVTAVIVLVLTLIVAAGLFALARMVGRIVLERQLGRIRRSARGAHALTTIFLFGAGLAFLRQTDWVMSAYRWTVGLFS